MRDFKLEVYFGQYEFTAPYLLTQSDCESMSAGELLALEPGMEEALHKSWLGYTQVPGDPALRELTAGLYRNMEAEHILMHAGAQEAIFAFMNAMLDKGDHVICLFPAYQSLYEVALSKGCEVSKWEIRHNGRGWSVDFDELKSLIRPNTRLIVINSPNNPTGYTFSEEEIKKLCAAADQNGLYIFADEVYKGLDLDGTQKPWVADEYDRAVSLGVMSKSYGLAGLRIGWVAAKERLVREKMMKQKHYLSISNSAPSELLAGIALKHSKTLLTRNMSIVKDNLALANMFFSKYSSLFQNNPPQCGPIAFHRILLKSMTVDEFCDKLVQKSGVLLLPSSMYEYPGDFFRMGYGRRNFPEALGKLEEYLISEKLV